MDRAQIAPRRRAVAPFATLQRLNVLARTGQLAGLCAVASLTGLLLLSRP